MGTTAAAVLRARTAGLAVPAFNIPYLPMMEPVIRAVVDCDAFALIETARLEWRKFGAGSPATVAEAFARYADLDYVGLHLDHVPAIDEDGLLVDYLPIFEEAIGLGYGSVMFDGSRLPLEQNIALTRQIAEMAHRAGIPCEAELGAVLGHEAGPLPPYEELFASGRGFTDPAEAARFVAETGCDWLSVAVGNIHGAISGAARNQVKVQARLNLEHLDRLHAATGIPLVLHGGSGIQLSSLRAAISRGIAKVNVGTELRRAYEGALRTGGETMGAQATYDATRTLLPDTFDLVGKRALVVGEAPG